MCSKAAIVAVAAALASGAAFAEMSFDDVKRWTEARDRECILSRERVSVGNEDFIVEHWRNPRDGREWRTNKVFKVVGARQPTTWAKELERLNAEIEKWTAQSAAFSNLYAAANAKIGGEIADLEAKIEKYEGYETKYPLLKTVWEALINDAQNRIKILEAISKEDGE